jgi:hypothetical protein
MDPSVPESAPTELIEDDIEGAHPEPREALPGDDGASEDAVSVGDTIEGSGSYSGASGTAAESDSTKAVQPRFGATSRPDLTSQPDEAPLKPEDIKADVDLDKVLELEEESEPDAESVESKGDDVPSPARPEKNTPPRHMPRASSHSYLVARDGFRDRERVAEEKRLQEQQANETLQKGRKQSPWDPHTAQRVSQAVSARAVTSAISTGALPETHFDAGELEARSEIVTSGVGSAKELAKRFQPETASPPTEEAVRPGRAGSEVQVPLDSTFRDAEGER